MSYYRSLKKRALNKQPQLFSRRALTAPQSLPGDGRAASPPQPRARRLQGPLAAALRRRPRLPPTLRRAARPLPPPAGRARALPRLPLPRRPTTPRRVILVICDWKTNWNNYVADSQLYSKYSAIWVWVWVAHTHTMLHGQKTCTVYVYVYWYSYTYTYT